MEPFFETAEPETLESGDFAPSITTDLKTLLASEVPEFARDVGTQAAKERYDATLTSMGADFILEEMARGNLPNMLALRYKIPVIVFRQWLKENTAADKLKEVMEYCAESMMVKSQLVLTQSPANAQIGAAVRAYSDRTAEIAAKVAPAIWGKQADTAQVTNNQGLTFNFPGGIPGVEWGGAPRLPLKVANPANAQNPLQTMLDIPGVSLLNQAAAQAAPAYDGEEDEEDIPPSGPDVWEELHEDPDPFRHFGPPDRP
jgi:hypothetical protein